MKKQKNVKSHNFKYKKHPEHKKITLKRIASWIGMFIFMLLSIFLVEKNTTMFQASIIPTTAPPAYDGTVSPIQQAPNWVAMNSAEYKMSYSDLSKLNKLEKIPTYNPSQLSMSTDSLVWGNPSHDAIRNAKITFSVPYMGNYKLDGREYAGSHLAVDIKIPMGTPVYAIGNGVVNKTSEQAYGFGKHIVVEHKNFPSIENQNTKTTYYSSYSHLNSINVTEGSVVRKGDIIAYSGNTGSSTTPHLHFQIDTTSAPWHPFWPFTSKEASDAGLTFTQAVNAGLNQNIAIQNTVNPMLYVQKYENGTVSTNVPVTTTTSTTTTTSPPPVETDPIVSNPVITEPVQPEHDPEPVAEEVTDEYVTFEIISSSTFTEGEPFEVQLRATDRSGNTIANYVPPSPVRIELTRGEGSITPTRLSSSNFNNGLATLTITPKSSSPIQFMIKTDTVMKESQVLAPGVFVDISAVHPHYQAISFLKDEGVIEGYPDGSFKPDNSVSRVEVLKFILEGINAELNSASNLPFNDTELSAWYVSYLATALNLGIVDGYPDGSFRPANSVNKVEFLKMLINAMDVDIDPEVKSLPFSDVDVDQWYAPYVQFAIQKNIIDAEGAKFDPTEQMKRDAVAEAMYRVKILTETGATTFTADVADDFIKRPA